MKFIKGLFAGLGIGLCVAPVVFAFAFILEIANCLLCGIPGEILYEVSKCDDNILELFYGSPCMNMHDGYGFLGIWNKGYFFNTFIFCTIAGTVVGAIYGIAKESSSSSSDTNYSSSSAPPTTSTYTKSNMAMDYNNRGSSDAMSGNFTSAISNYTKAMELGLTDAQIYCSRGNCYYQTGNHTKAIQDWEKALSINPSHHEAWDNLQTLKAML